MSTVQKPWIPIETEETSQGITVKVVGRSYFFGNSIFPESIIADGEELLAEPIRVVGLEYDKPIEWHTKKLWIMKKEDAVVELNAAMESYLKL